MAGRLRRHLNYKTFGKGKDIVFLHGWGASVSAFLFVAKKFSRNYRVTVLDFAGFGESAEPTSPYTVADYANDVLSLMDSIGIEQAIFVGHSFGGRVAMELAAKHADRVRAIVLVDSAGLKPRRGMRYYLRVGIHKLLKKLGFRGLKGASDYRMLTPVMKQTFKNVVNYDQTHLLCNINCPCAIFWGKQDKDTPSYMARKLKRGIKNSELFWLDGGHFAYVDDFNKFYVILFAFLRSLDSQNGEVAV